MKTEHYYLWRTLWNGKMSTTRHLSTEEAIRKTHPEAVRVESSHVERQIPDTEEERRLCFVHSATAYSGTVPRRVDGSVIKLGERSES